MSAVEKGQSVWLERLDHRGRHKPDAQLEEVTIAAVGRKYFSINGTYRSLQFRIEDLRQVTDYSPDFLVWLSVKDREDAMELRALSQQIRKVFTDHVYLPFSLDQLRRIKSIIDEPLRK